MGYINEIILICYYKTSILKVLHVNTKSPAGCMYTWRYNILYLTILYNVRNVSVFVCIAFKNTGDWLTCQKSAQYLQGYRKKVWKTIPSMKFTKSKASISAKNQWGAMKLQLDVKVMMIDLHAKNQLNICKHLGKNCRKLFDRWNLLSPRSVISPKIDGA